MITMIIDITKGVGRTEGIFPGRRNSTPYRFPKEGHLPPYHFKRQKLFPISSEGKKLSASFISGLKKYPPHHLPASSVFR